MTTKNTAAAYQLKNVRLETGFRVADGEIVATNTDLFLITVNNGKITAIEPNRNEREAIDAKGHLLLPAFQDMHAHLDKHLFGLPWKAVSNAKRTVKDMIALEQQIIPTLLTTSIERSKQLITMLQSYGTTFARSHVNIDPTSGLHSLEHLCIALDAMHDSFSAELVAFPQHGLFYTATAPLMKEAASLPEVKFIGGLDPFSIDGDIAKSIDFTVQLAVDNHKGIDIHLHETGESGVRTMQYLSDKVSENPELKGRTFISHAFALAHLPEKQVEQLAETFAANGIGIVSSVPIRGHLMPIPTLLKKGVCVQVGNDNIQDHWSTFGSGNMLQKMQCIAELYSDGTEYALSRTLKLATNGITPLRDDGAQQWPKAGDKANMLLVDASCSAEAVSRISAIKSLIHNGKIIF